MSYDSAESGSEDLKDRNPCLAVRNADGNWVNAVDRNTGGTKKFIVGPWSSEYTLGTYGVDTSTSTAWAVINCAGDFAVSKVK